MKTTAKGLDKVLIKFRIKCTISTSLVKIVQEKE